MHLTIQNVFDSSKWELAQSLAYQTTFTERLLNACFTGVIEGFKQEHDILFPSSTKERIWRTFSQETLLPLRELLADEIYERVLVNFSQDEITVLLEKQKINYLRDSLFKVMDDVAIQLIPHLSQHLMDIFQSKNII